MGGRGGRDREGEGGRRDSKGLWRMFVYGGRVVGVVVVGKVEDGEFTGRNVCFSLWEVTQRVECAGAVFVRECAADGRHL